MLINIDKYRNIKYNSNRQLAYGKIYNYQQYQTNERFFRKTSANISK